MKKEQKINIVYYSKTGQTLGFVEKLLLELKNINVTEIKTSEEIIKEPYVLLTPTYMFGEVPKEVDKFFKVEENRDNIIGVVSSGNKNWGVDNFANSGRIISKTLNVPLLHRYEMRGNKKDVDIVKNELIKIFKER